MNASSGSVRQLVLESLADKAQVISQDASGFFKENCLMCFDKGGHESGVGLRVDFEKGEEVFEVVWSGEVIEQLRLSYADLPRTTDHAACAIALLLVPELTGLTAIRQSSTGTTIDYYLGQPGREGDLIFNDTARLEATGILCENPGNSVSKRMKEKVKRLKPDPNLPSYIIVVEFSQPWSKVEYHG